MQEKIVDGLDVMKLTELRDNYVDILAESELDAPNYRAEKVKSRLQNHFGDKLAFWQPNQRSVTEIVFSKQVSTGQTVEAAVVAAAAADLPVQET